jgi:Zn finger protein HypA/HybF involved in hydrogenase expression
MTARSHEASARKNFMPQGYCVKCKAKKEIVDAVEETMKNGRKAIKGKCPTCGTVMFKILGGKTTNAPAAAPLAEPAPEATTTPKPG